MDLPGYGFAEAPVAVVARWQALLKAYLAGRPTLRRAFVLIDARHGVKAVDEEILTLLDQLGRDLPGGADQGRQDRRRRDRAKVLEQVRGALRQHPAAFPEIVVTSSETGEGIATLRAIVAAIEE